MSRITVHRRSLHALLLTVAAALVLTGCGFSAQTLQPYTPSNGVNLDVGAIKVRNLVVIADGEGNGILSGSLVSSADDALASVQVVPLLTGNEPGSPLTVTPTRNVPLTANELAILTDPTPAVIVSGQELAPGQTVTVTLGFASGTTGEVTAPVMTHDDPAYEGIATDFPVPAATPEATATPTA